MSTRSVEAPWEYSSDVVDGEIIYQEAESAPLEFFQPKWFGIKEFPLADAKLPQVIRYPRPQILRAKNIALLPNHVVIDTQTNRITAHTFMRNRLNHHGGVRVGVDGLYTPKYNVSKMDTTFVEGSVYLADTDHPKVYGHVLLEVFSSFWALDVVGREGVRIATSVQMNDTYRSFFEALGVMSDRVITIKGPTIAEKTYLPSKLIQRRQYIDPKVRKVYHQVQRIFADASTVQVHEKIYISRSRISGRRLLNELQVEELFLGLGFSIIHPQDLSAADQVKIFSNACLIAGSGGSAMHNSLFANENSKVLILASTGWVVVADPLICNKENQLAYVFGKPIFCPPGTHRTQSDWNVDLEHVKEAVEHHFGL